MKRWKKRGRGWKRMTRRKKRRKRWNRWERKRMRRVLGDRGRRRKRRRRMRGTRRERISASVCTRGDCDNLVSKTTIDFAKKETRSGWQHVLTGPEKGKWAPLKALRVFFFSSSFRASTAEEMFQFPLFLMLVCVIFLSQRNKYGSRYGTFEQHV